MPIDRNTWKTLNTSDEQGDRIFKQQLVQNLNESFSGGSLAQQLSGQQGGVSGAALHNFSQTYSSGSTVTANAANAYAVHINWTITGGGPYLLTIQNLLVGSPVTIKLTNSTGGSATVKFAAKNPAGIAYTINAKSSSYIDMVGTGVTMASGGNLIFNGNSSLVGTTPDLELVYN